MKWKTKDGRLIELKNMEDMHLLRCHRLICNRLVGLNELEDFAYSPFAPSEGTMASDDLERAMQESFDESMALLNVKSKLEKEINKRKLKPLDHKEKQPLPEIEKVINVKAGEGNAVIFKLK